MLDAGRVGAIKSSLSVALDAPNDLDDAARIDTIRALEELACVVTAAQAALSVELDESRRAKQADAGVPKPSGAGAWPPRSRWPAASHPTAGSVTWGWPRSPRGELPHTWQAWRSGRITEWKATLIARETACLTRDDRAAVDDAVGGDIDRRERMGDRELEMACQKGAYRLDPESYVARRRQAEAAAALRRPPTRPG